MRANNNSDLFFYQLGDLYDFIVQMVFTRPSVHRIHRILYIIRAQIIPPQQKGGIETPKNVTIYLPDEIAGKMTKYPEVNWSEICRKAVADYVETRDHMDMGPILEKLKAERNEAYKQGQILFYQLAPKLNLRQYERIYTRVNKKLLESIRADMFGETPGLSPEAAEECAIHEMGSLMNRYCKENNMECQLDASFAFWEGAKDAFMQVYNKIALKKT